MQWPISRSSKITWTNSRCIVKKFTGLPGATAFLARSFAADPGAPCPETDRPNNSPTRDLKLDPQARLRHNQCQSIQVELIELPLQQGVEPRLRAPEYRARPARYSPEYSCGECAGPDRGPVMRLPRHADTVFSGAFTGTPAGCRCLPCTASRASARCGRQTCMTKDRR